MLLEGRPTLEDGDDDVGASATPSDKDGSDPSKEDSVRSNAGLVGEDRDGHIRPRSRDSDRGGVSGRNSGHGDRSSSACGDGGMAASAASAGGGDSGRSSASANGRRRVGSVSSGRVIDPLRIAQTSTQTGRLLQLLSDSGLPGEQSGPFGAFLCLYFFFTLVKMIRFLINQVNHNFWQV